MPPETPKQPSTGAEHKETLSAIDDLLAKLKMSKEAATGGTATPLTENTERQFDAQMRALMTTKTALEQERAALLGERSTLAQRGAESAQIEEVQRSLDGLRQRFVDCSSRLQLYESTGSMLAEWDKLNVALNECLAHVASVPTSELTDIYQKITDLEKDLVKHFAQISALERK